MFYSTYIAKKNLKPRLGTVKSIDFITVSLLLPLLRMLKNKDTGFTFQI